MVQADATPLLLVTETRCQHPGRIVMRPYAVFGVAALLVVLRPDANSTRFGAGR